MLIRVKEDEIDRIQKMLAEQPDFGVRVSALLKAYGAGQEFFSAWHQNYNTVLARLESSFFICAGEGADFEEIAFFLDFNPYFHRLTGKTQTVEDISACLSHNHKKYRSDFLAGEKNLTGTDDRFEIDAAPSLEDVYKVISAAQTKDFTVGDFVPWYVDISHRIRHDCARAYLLKADNIPVSTCIISAESDFAGFISGVATIPQYRSRGFAASVVRRASFDLAECGKLPVLECLPYLTDYYIKLGFKKIGETEQLIIDQ
jgi:ribosomal protein S18 acetylase RimI-like enzyme